MKEENKTEDTRQTLDERAEFEKWCRRHCSPGGEQSEFYWQIWQAARETQRNLAKALLDFTSTHDMRWDDLASETEWGNIVEQARAKLGQSYRGLDPSSNAPQKHGVEGDDRDRRRQ